jgi:hypothetical protein
MFMDGSQNTPVSARQSILLGCKEAGRLFVGLLIMCAVGALFLLSTSIWSRVPAFLFLGTGISLLTGPVTFLLVLFDISNTHLYILWPVLIVPYWVCLGGVIGRLSRQTLIASGGEKMVRHSSTHLRWKIGSIAILLAVITYPLGPIAGSNFIRKGPSFKIGIMNNLRQLDGAKQQLAFEKRLAADYVPTESELAPYLGRPPSPGLKPIGPERYVLNSIDTAPYAILDSDWRIRRRGWHAGYTIPKGTRYEIEKGREKVTTPPN